VGATKFQCWIVFLVLEWRQAMKNSTIIAHKIILCLMIVNIFSLAAEVILLKGACSAGKTSLINKAVEIDPKIYSLREDDHVINSFTEFFKQQFPDDCTIITNAITPENLLHAITRRVIAFKCDSPSDAQEKAISSIQKIRTRLEDPSNELKLIYVKSLNESINKDLDVQLSAGKSILLDGWRISPKEIDDLRHKTKVITVFVHCSAEKILQRLAHRNDKSKDQVNIREHRFHSQALRSFKSFYRPTPNPDIAVDSITKKALVDHLQAIKAKLIPTSNEPPSGRFTYRDFTQEELQEYQEQLLAKLGLTDKDDEATSPICPDLSYDYLINTDNLSPEEAALKLLKLCYHCVDHKCGNGNYA
jgi:ribose 1,5-bisphosphokinase PhnN